MGHSWVFSGVALLDEFLVREYSGCLVNGTPVWLVGTILDLQWVGTHNVKHHAALRTYTQLKHPKTKVWDLPDFIISKDRMLTIKTVWQSGVECVPTASSPKGHLSPNKNTNLKEYLIDPFCVVSRGHDLMYGVFS